MRQANFSARIVAVLLAMMMAMPQWLLAATPITSPELPDPGSPAGVSKQQQEQVGLQAMAQVYQQMPVLPDSSPVAQYVQALGRKLVPVIPAQNSWPYQFHVIPQKDINAFALPGGPIFINLGTITAADNEAELAGVMAHEMSHVYMQHSAKAASKDAMTQGLLGVLGSLLGQGTLGNIARMGIQIGGGLVSMKYSRADEAQADAVGAVIMYKAGYNPQAMAQFFQKLESQGGGAGPQMLSDHPNPGNRVASVDKEIQNWPPKNYLGSTPAFASAKQQSAGIQTYTAQQIADGAKQGTWARQNKQSGATPANLPSVPGGNGTAGGQSQGNGNIASVTADQAKPSSHFTQLNQGGIAMSYPDNWQVSGGGSSGDQSAGLTIAPAAGVSQGNVAYGVVINAAQDQNSSSLDDTTQKLIQSLQQSNSGLQVSGNISSANVNGMQGRQVMLTGASPVQQNGQPLPETDWLVTLPMPQGNGSFVYMVFVAPQNTFGRFKSTYDKMLKSVRLQ